MHKPPPVQVKRDLFASHLAKKVRSAHGEDAAHTFDESAELGQPRGYAPTNNIALDRAIGCPGIPLGRITEISGWEAAGKSTCLDQIFAATQAIGGLAVLADTERARDRAYMGSLGIENASLVDVAAKSIESMFDEIETLVRASAHLNAVAWHRAIRRSGIKIPPLSSYKHVVYDSTGRTKKVVNSEEFAVWGRMQAASLLEYQKANSLHPSGLRDSSTREHLRPVVVHDAPKEDQKAALKDWDAGKPNDLTEAADRMIVIGWDSVAGTATEAELEGSASNQHVATAAKVIRRNLRRIIQWINDEAVALILINQRYEKINTTGATWGVQSETYGGGGIKYHSTLRVELQRIGQIYNPGTKRAAGDPPAGQEVLIRVPKNKLSDPNREEKFGLFYGKGAIDSYAIHEDLKERGIIRAASGWSRFTDSSILNEDKSFRGWHELEELMRNDSDLNSTLRDIYHEGR